MSCQQTQDFLAQATKLGMTLKDIYLNPLCYNLDIDFSSRTVYAATLIQGNQIRIYSMDMDSQSPVTLAWFSEAQLMTDFGLLPLSAATPVGKLLVRGNTAWLALELGLLKIDFSQPSVRLVLSTQGLSQQIGAELPDNPIRITNLFQDEAGHIWIENTDPVYGELHLHLLNEEQGITQFLGFTHDALYNPKSYGFHAQPFPGSTILLPFQSRLFQTEEGLWAGAGRDWTRIGLETSPAREDFTTRITLGAPSPTNLAPGSILSVPVSQTETLDILGTAAGIPGQRTTQGLEFPITSHTFMFDEVLRGAVFVDKFGYRSHPFDGIPYGPYLPDLNTILQPPSVESLAIPNLVVRTPYELSNLLRTTGAYNQIEFIQRDEAGKIIAKDSYPSSNLGGSQPEILHGIPEIFHTGSQSLQIDVSGPKGQSTTRVGFNYLSGSQAILGAAGPGLPINFSGLSGDRMVPLSDGSLAVYTRDEALDATNYDFSQPVYVHHPGKPVRRFFLRDPNGNQQIRIHGLAQNSLGEIFVLYGSSPSIIAKLPNLEDYALDSHITPEPFLMIHAEIHEIAFHEGYLVAAGLPASRGFTDPFYGKFVPSISPLADALFVLRFPKNPENDITLAQPVQTNQTLYTNAPSFLKQSGGELFLGVSTASSAHLLRITHPDSENMAFTLLLNWGEVTPNTQTYQVRSFTDISYGSSYLKVIPSPNPTSSFGGGYTYAHSGPVMGVFFNGFDLGSSIMAYNNSEGTYGNPDSANSPHIQEYSSSSLAISQIPGHEVIYRLNSQKALEAIEPGGMVIPLSEAQTSRLDGIRHQSEFRDGLLRIAMTEEPRAGIYFIQESDKGLYFLDLTTRKIHPFPSAFFYQDIVPSPLGGIYALNNKMAIQYLKFDGVWTDVWEDTFGGSLHPPLPDFIRASFDVSSDNRYIYLAQMDKVYIWDLESALNGPSNPPTLPASPTLTEIQIPENLGPNVTLRRSKDRLYYANTDGFSQKIYSVSTNTAESPILIGEGNNQIYRKNLMHRIGDTVYAERISSYQPFEFTLGENGLNLESSSEISSLFDPYQSMYYPSILADSSHNARYNFNHYLRTWAKLGNRVFGIYWDYNKRHSVIRMAYANETAPETSLGASISVSAQQIQTEFGFASEFSLGVSNATTMLSYFTESAQLGQVVTSLVSGGTYNWSRTVRTAEIPHSPLNPNYVSGMSPSGQIKVWELPTTTNAEIANASKALDFKASSTQLVFVTGSHFDATVGTEITSGTDTLIQIQYIDMNQSREIPSRSEGTLLSTTVFNLGMPAYLPEYRTSVSPTTLVTNLPVRLIQDINPTNNTRYHHSFNLSGKTDVCLDPYLLHPSSELLFLNSYPSGVVNESYFCIRLNTTGQNTLDYSIEEESYLTPITQ